MFRWMKKVRVISRFVWQEWIDAAIGFLTGYNSRGGGKMKYQCIIKAELRDGIATSASRLL